MRARHVFLTAVLTALWAGAAAAQAISPPANPAVNLPAAAGDAKVAPTALPAPGVSAPADSAKATSEVGRFGNLVPSPSTGSDDSSPAPIPGSPPTAPR